MHPSWTGLFLTIAAACLASWLAAVRISLGPVLAQDQSVHSVVVSSAACLRFGVSSGIAVADISANGSNVWPVKRYTAACGILPRVPLSMTVTPSWVATTTSSTCYSVGVCKTPGSFVDTMSGATVTCRVTDTVAGTQSMFSGALARMAVFSGHREHAAGAQHVIVTAACWTRSWLFAANGTRIAEFWPPPDGSASVAVVRVADDTASVMTPVGCRVIGRSRTSGLDAFETPLCGYDNRTDSALVAGGWISVPVMATRFGDDYIAISSTTLLNSTFFLVRMAFHGWRFRDARVYAVCGTLMAVLPSDDMSVNGRQTVMAGTMGFASVACNTRAFSMLIQSEMRASLLGTRVWVRPNTTCAPDASAVRFGADNADLPGLPALNGDPYYVVASASVVERVVFDTSGTARLLLPPNRTVCFVVRGWTPDAALSNITDWRTQYTPCANPASTCYLANSTIVLPPVLRTTSVAQTVYAGGTSFSVPWPPDRCTSVSNSTPVFRESSSYAMQMLSEWCGTILFWYIESTAVLCGVSGSVLRSAVGALPCIWTVPDANSTMVQQCGMLKLWRTSQGTVVASPTQSRLVRATSLTCQTTQRCVILSPIINATESEWALNPDLNVNSVYFKAPTCL